jgi:hypothetical protein
MRRQKRKFTKRKQGSSIDPKFIRFKKWVMALFALMIFGLPVVVSFADEELLWRNSDNGIVEAIVTAVCVIKERPNIVYAGGERSIYKSIDSGNNWVRVFMLKGGRKGVNFISYDPKDFSKIFAATSDGLYISQDDGNTWHRSFKGMDDLQRHVNCIDISPDSGTILIGTKRGLFKSCDKAKSWSAEETFINRQINSVAIGDNCLYVCAIDGVYYTKRGYVSWDRIYVVKTHDEKGADQYNNNGGNDNRDGYSELNYLVIDDKRVYLATGFSLYTSLLESRDWQMVTYEGLLTRQVESVLAIGARIFVVTGKGVFEYNKKADIWRSCSVGLATLRINMIDASSAQGLIYAATDRGLFSAELDKVSTGMSVDTKEEYNTIYNKEPGILEIQQVTVDYAEVYPDKIKWMRRSAQNKALLPKVSFGMDGNMGRTVNLDRGSTTTPDFYIEGPIDRNFGWDIDFSWDLGELIWNHDQTNIDVRSRLMVQLRNDLLDEVTKLYFERRRLQMELLRDPPDDNKRAFKQLRLDELTASIDGLTGGYLSERLQ